MSNKPSAHDLHGPDVHRQRARALKLFKESPAAALEKYPEFIPDFVALTNPVQAELEHYRRTGEVYYNPAEDELVKNGINSPEQEEK